jgi:AAA family ATP:ADP antiporter
MSLCITLSAALNIRPGEGRSTVLLLLHSFCLGTATVSFSTAATALFLAAFDAGKLPYVYIGSAAATVLVGFLYNKLQTRLPFATLRITTLVFLLVTVCAFRFGLAITTSKWLSFALLFWLRMLLVLTTLEFWGLAAGLFNVRQGKRLFGLIGSGELAANILGGFATPVFVMLLGTPNLLFLSATGIGLALVLLLITVRNFANRLVSPQDRENTEEKTSGNDLLRLLNNPYIMLIILSNVLMVIVYNFVDYTFYDYTKARYQDEALLASFLGPFFAVVQSITVVMKTFFASRLFSRYGLQFGLLAHPLLLIAGTGSIALTHASSDAAVLLFWLVAVTKLCDEVLWTSIYEPSLLILYQPLRAEQRRAVPVAVQSIFGPLAIGLSGVIFLLLETTDFFTSMHLTYIIPGLLVGAILAARHVNREYASALTQALAKRILGGADLSLHDGSSLAVLQQKLRSSHPGEIHYALNVLEEIGHESLPAFLGDLLEHPHATIRQDVLGRIERIKAVDALAAVRQHMAVTENPQVRAAALRALCALGETEVVEHVAAYLSDAHADVRMGAMVGLLRYGGIEGVLAAGEHLIRATQAPDPVQRAFAAQGLGEVGVRNFYQPLVPLLHDEDTEVRRAALAAAGKIQHPKLWPHVLVHLNSPAAGSAAASALIAGGEAALPELRTVFTLAGQERATRVRIARICGRIRGPHAITVLQEHLDVSDVAVRNGVLLALSLCGYRAQDGERLRIQRHIDDEVEHATWILAALADIGNHAAVSLLRTALQHNLVQLCRRLFLLLSFIYEAQPMLRAWENLAHDSAEKRAYALEIIDVLVASELKPLLLPLLDELSPIERLQRLSVRFPQLRLGCHQRLREIVTRPEQWTHPWTKASALYTMAQLAAVGCVDVVISALSAPDALVRETAWCTLAKLDAGTCRRYAKELHHDSSPSVARVLRQFETQGEGHDIMLSTIEKVIILKTVSLFVEVPDEILADVASILDEVEVKAGETIFTKGDIGQCMYIIVDGHMRVHDGELTIAQLGERDIFGELAVLDMEPRSASVTAVDDARLFRLDQDAFYELMADRIEVARGVIRVLCRLLRSRTTAMREDNFTDRDEG